MVGIIHKNVGFQPHPLLEMIPEWHENGLIPQDDPLHFMTNMIALSIFSFIGKPMVEAISGAGSEMTAIVSQAVRSVVRVLQRGMLKWKNHFFTFLAAAFALPAASPCRRRWPTPGSSPAASTARC